MSDEIRNFLLAIRSGEDVENARLVFADWLEEQGDGRSEVVRGLPPIKVGDMLHLDHRGNLTNRKTPGIANAVAITNEDNGKCVALCITHPDGSIGQKIEVAVERKEFSYPTDSIYALFPEVCICEPRAETRMTENEIFYQFHTDKLCGMAKVEDRYASAFRLRESELNL